MRKNIVRLLSTVLLAVAFVIPSFAEDFNINGSRGAVKLLQSNKDAIEQQSGVKLKLNGQGSSKGLRNLGQEKIELAILSASYKSVLPKVNKKYKLSFTESDFVEEIVSEQSLAIIVNEDNPVSSLTRAQLHDIFVGKITNWKDVGGADKKIVVLPGKEGSGVRTLLENSLLEKGEKFVKSRGIESVQAVRFVTKNDNAITAGSSSYVRKAKIINITEGEGVVQRYYLVSKGGYSGDKSKVMEAIKAVLNK